jgi:hypothetical protein
MISRRSLIAKGTRFTAGAALSRFALATKPTSISVRLSEEHQIVEVPPGFIGLGFEKSSAAVVSLLSHTNERYVQLVRNLGGKGVLRIGGIVADFSRYEPEGISASEPKNTVVTRQNLKQLRGFLDATGWSVIWSLNFGQGTLADALREVEDVAAILGPGLDSIELGNEVENYGNGPKPLRPPPYTFENYLAEYDAWNKVITQAVPALRFAAPDTAGSVEWVEKMAAIRPAEVQLLTTHYYRGNQRQGSADQLTYPDPNLGSKLERLAHASQKSGIPWRMCESNSFSGGGLPGVSDTLLGSLWTLDYLLLLAQSGCSGVNIETGVNQLGFVSSYSPIQDDENGINSAGTPYYGMLGFVTALAHSSHLLPVVFDDLGINLTIYVSGEPGRPRSVVVVNRDPRQDAIVSVVELRIGKGTAYRLLAPSPYSKTGITFGGEAVGDHEQWTPTAGEQVHNGYLNVPRMSAVVFSASSPTHAPEI